MVRCALTLNGSANSANAYMHTRIFIPPPLELVLDGLNRNIAEPCNDTTNDNDQEGHRLSHRDVHEREEIDELHELGGNPHARLSLEKGDIDCWDKSQDTRQRERLALPRSTKVKQEHQRFHDTLPLRRRTPRTSLIGIERILTAFD